MDAPAASLTTRLYQLASNLLWTWEPEVIGIFRDLDPDLWRQVNHNPVALLAALPAEQLVRRAVETVCGQGYVQQRVDAQGWQHESYGHVDLELLPLRRAVGAGDQPLTVELPIGGQSLRVAAWRAQAGRATLLLLDSDVDGNPPGLRSLTAQLYGGDLVTRLRQELILGIGGVRMLVPRATTTFRPSSCSNISAGSSTRPACRPTTCWLWGAWTDAVATDGATVRLTA